MQNVNVEINGEIKSYPYGTTYNDIINYLNKDRAQKILAVKVNNELTPLSMKCTHDCSLKLVDVMDNVIIPTEEMMQLSGKNKEDIINIIITY